MAEEGKEDSDGPSLPKCFRSGKITVRNLRLNTSLVPDAWGRAGKEQPTLVSVTLSTDDHLAPAAIGDDVTSTVSYSDLARAARRMHEQPAQTAGGGDEKKGDVAPDIAPVHSHLCRYLSGLTKNGDGYEVKTMFPKGLKRGGGGSWGVRSRPVARSLAMDYLLKDLNLACIIGVNPHERLDRQTVVVSVEARALGSVHGATFTKEFLALTERLIQVVEDSTFQTVEALALKVATFFREDRKWSRTKVKIEKPNAIALVDGCGVDIEFDWTSWFQSEQTATLKRKGLLR